MSSKDELKPDVDEDLSTLLDSVLSDLTESEKSEEKPTEEKAPEEGVSEDDELTKELFRQASRLFSGSATGEGAEERMKEVMATEEFRTFAQTITETVEGLNTELQGAFANDTDLMDSILDQNGPLLPTMQGMMQNLLSKDVLYPSIKEINDRFPQWLDENRTKITETEFGNYRRQHELMGEVCRELETESSGDDEVRKKQRFEKVLNLMQKMQEFGDPPQELVQLSGGGSLGEPPQCCIM